MLLAVLYCEPDRIAAVAMACDQMPMGDRYWLEMFPGELPSGSVFETAYVMVNNHELCFRLLNLGMDNRLDGQELARELEAHAAPQYERVASRAA